jgi:hypothetical protein
MIPAGSFDELERGRERLIGEQQRTHVHLTMGELKRNVVVIARLVAIACMILVTFTAMAACWEVHLQRRARAAELAELKLLREGLLERFDSLGWKMDTQAEATIAMARNLRDAMLLVRSQIHENTTVTAKAATANTKIAAEAVRATAATTQIADAIAGTDQAPVVHVEVPKAAPPVVVQTPAVPAAATTPASPPAAAESKGGVGHVIKKIICPWCGHGRKTD